MAGNLLKCCSKFSWIVSSSLMAISAAQKPPPAVKSYGWLLRSVLFYCRWVMTLKEIPICFISFATVNGKDVGSNILLRANLNREDLSNTVPLCKKRSFVSFPLLLPVRIQPKAKREGEQKIPSERQTERNLLACIMMIFMGPHSTHPLGPSMLVAPCLIHLMAAPHFSNKWLLK